ncbi:hypothetical protein RD792_005850 [Penstemon davidsonii]|uniref:Protein FLUORESCENT IN BLUE LIGHT, chloroplastic-like n=1 Tax=Penstemon davidsonii TaxID=160366 RepID=A0ABR0DEY1_9LAMI|nr:hypothetical protein RD792_005850 [Penstemon davidsonii]
MESEIRIGNAKCEMRNAKCEMRNAKCEMRNAKERFNSRLPATTVVVSNALLMFAKPLEALAETCEADNSVFNMNMPLLLFVALIGATVGGLLARQRKGELQRLNEQLRQINAALRRQAKIESYAPNLSYAPINGRIAENETALELAQNLDDKTEEKKAARGLGASLQRQGKYRDAIKYHSMVLEISEKEGEESGNAEAYGAIADCYTELEIWNELRSTMTSILGGYNRTN